MLDKPMNRICPSLSCVAFSNTARHLGGLMKGNMPSTTSISANAPSRRSQKVATDKGYFLGAGVPAAAPPPRMALKNSLPGSTTITSVLFRKLTR